MKRVIVVVLVSLALVAIGNGARGLDTVTVACTAGTTLSSPVTSTVWCQTPVVSGNGPSDIATARVVVSGTGMVGGSVEIKQGPYTSPPSPLTTVSKRACGPVPLSCQAAMTYIGPSYDTWPTAYRALCAWTGVVSASTSITCELTFQQQ
jgi:hypothetical protein